MPRGRSGYLPKWWKGRKLLDHYSGEEIFEYASTTRIQEGKYIHVKNFDSLTERQREESLQNRMR